MRAHDRERALGAVRGADGDELALVGDVDGIDPEQLGRGGDLGAHRDVLLAHGHPDARLASDLVERGAQPAAGGIAQRVDLHAAFEQRRDEAVQRRGVALDGGLELEVLAARQDGDAVIAERAAHQDHVPRPGAIAARRDDRGRDHPDAGGVDEYAITLAALDHLGVAGDDRHAGGARRVGHRMDDAREIGEGQALFEDEAGGEPERPRAAHGDVVDGAVHGELADVASREEQRRDHVGVGAEDDLARRRREARAVVLLREVGVVEGPGEEHLDELGGGAPARPVDHLHPASLEIDHPRHAHASPRR